MEVKVEFDIAEVMVRYESELKSTIAEIVEQELRAAIRKEFAQSTAIKSEIRRMLVEQVTNGVIKEIAKSHATA